MSEMKLEKIYEVLRIKQVIQENSEGLEIKTVRSPSDAAEIAHSFIGDEDREVLFLMCLNTKNQITVVHRCHVGSLNSSIVHPRELFKTAILNNAASIIMAHNHPGFNPQPSPEDVEVTKRISQAGELLGVGLLDSLIVTNDSSKYLSMKEKGYM